VTLPDELTLCVRSLTPATRPIIDGTWKIPAVKQAG